MQRGVMQSDAAVFRTAETLNEGKPKLAAVFASFFGREASAIVPWYGTAI